MDVLTDYGYIATAVLCPNLFRVLLRKLLEESRNIRIMEFITVTSTVIAALTLMAVGNPTANEARAPAEDPSYLITDAQFKAWLTTKDLSDITWIGKLVNPLTRRSAENTIVTFCSNRIDDVCGRPCSVYNGGPTCIDAPDTNCLCHQ
ncbi:hypothetical protein C8J56DRAFT_1065304 [Mycena floridula]|nr:hypothetical protein C8J56DRAFT_1065304 [Mycena floridula]